MLCKFAFLMGPDFWSLQLSMLHSIKVNRLHLFYELIRQDQIVCKTQTIQKPSNISTKKIFLSLT